MNVILQSKERTLLSVSPEELVGICNALNEICNDRHLADVEFQTRLGVTREFLVGLINQMPGEVSPCQGATERADVWAAEGAVHMLSVSAYGDPVELNGEEARAFAARLTAAIEEAE